MQMRLTIVGNLCAVYFSRWCNAIDHCFHFLKCPVFLTCCELLEDEAQSEFVSNPVLFMESACNKYLSHE